MGNSWYILVHTMGMISGPHTADEATLIEDYLATTGESFNLINDQDYNAMLANRDCQPAIRLFQV